MPLTTVIEAEINANLTSALDLGTAAYPSDVLSRLTLTSGTGNNQADLVFNDTRTVAASGTDALDLAGALTGPLGGLLTFVKLKALMVRAARATPTTSG
jgi:hypothetical protein